MKAQRLFFPINKPVTYFGLSVDELLVLLIGCGGGMLLMSSYPGYGLIMMIQGIGTCRIIKSIKKMQAGRLRLKSLAMAAGIVGARHCDYPVSLTNKVYHG